MSLENYKDNTIIVGKKKFVTTYSLDEQNNIIKSVKEYALETKRLPKNVAERRKWTKFGVSKGLPSGPDSASTAFVVDDVFIEYNRDKPLDDTVQNPLSMLGNDKQGKTLKCRHCGGSHWSIKCPNKELISNIKKGSIEEKKKEKYVPIFKRDGFDKKKRSRENTIHVSNISQNATENDMRDLFYSFGKIKNIYYHNKKGFAFITFDSLKACEQAVERVNGYGYDYLILTVTIAK